MIPWDFLRFREIFQYMQNFLFIEKDITKGNERFSGLGISQTSNHGLLNDFSISVNKTNTEIFSTVLFCNLDHWNHVFHWECYLCKLSN